MLLVTSFTEQNILQQLATNWQNGVRVRLFLNAFVSPQTQVALLTSKLHTCIILWMPESKSH